MTHVQFAIEAKVEFGQTVGVLVGTAKRNLEGTTNNFHLDPCQLNDVLPLEWSEGHVWRGEMVSLDDSFVCRFVVFHEDSNSSRILIDIEEGPHRHYCLSSSQQTSSLLPFSFASQQQQLNSFEISESFNLRKVVVQLYAESGCQMYVQGKISQMSTPQLLKECSNQQVNNVSLYFREFRISMRIEYMRYFYIKNLQSIERGIGRYLQFNEGVRKPTAIFHSEYIADHFKCTLQYSEINDKLVIGTFINCAEDIEELHSIGVTAIICLQSDFDLKRKYVNQGDMRRLAKAKGIVYRHVPIRDKDPIHYIERAPEALRNLENLAKAEHKVYVHCNAGIGRAPQTAILHLIITGRLSLEQASQRVFHKRSVAQPNKEAIVQVLKKLSEDSYDFEY